MRRFRKVSLGGGGYLQEWLVPHRWAALGGLRSSKGGQLLGTEAPVKGRHWRKPDQGLPLPCPV